MTTEYARKHMERMIDKLDEVSQWVDSAMARVAEAEMAELAKRFPNRRIELHSGMGSTFLIVHKRNPLTAGDYWSYHGERGTSYHDWPQSVAVPMPGLWEAIEVYQDNVTRGIDPGFGTIVYENGKCIKCLTESVE